jgi:hypothetical protein
LQLVTLESDDESERHFVLFLNLARLVGNIAMGLISIVE